uniref:FBA domain-containing protein n=1 Tax=Gongylonema pulchrum TaxID=637853 RepID=A0A183EN91_9BILA
LTEIFRRIDDAKTVGYICPLVDCYIIVFLLVQVCRRWHYVLSLPGFWISYMKYRSQTLPPHSLRLVPELNTKKVAFIQPFGKNLITNPSGENSMGGWIVTDKEGHGFNIERPPNGCAECLEEHISVAFVTSYGWCRKYYVVDLWKEGIEVSWAIVIDCFVILDSNYISL